MSKEKPFESPECCAPMMKDWMNGCTCTSFMKRRPVLMSLFCALMGLAFLLIPAGVILGIVAFFRTI